MIDRDTLESKTDSLMFDNTKKELAEKLALANRTTEKLELDNAFLKSQVRSKNYFK